MILKGKIETERDLGVSHETAPASDKLCFRCKGGITAPRRSHKVSLDLFFQLKGPTKSYFGVFRDQRGPYKVSFLIEKEFQN